MPKNGVLILECIDASDPGSEGLFLSHMFDLMSVDHQYIEVRTKEQFMILLVTSPYKFIHISTHGKVRKIKGLKKFQGLWFIDGDVTKNDIDSIKGKLKSNIVISTACLSGKIAFARYFVKTTGCKCYVAPFREPRFHNAVFFAHILYHKYFILHKSIRNAITEYKQRYKNPHGFRYVQ